MNTYNPSTRSDDEALLDLLVDGELPDDARRELLLAFERDPAGWRRCALAFLEAQQWQSEFGAMTRRPEGATGSSLPVQTAKTSPRNDVAWSRFKPGSLFALAAGVLIVFGLGLAASRWTRQGVGSGDGAMPMVAHAPRHVGQSHMGPGQLMPAAATSPWQAVTLSEPGPGGKASEVAVPVLDGTLADADWWQAAPSALPDELRRMIESRGHHVVQQRELLPVQLDDGRQALVPVDQVEIQPVGARSFH